MASYGGGSISKLRPNGYHSLLEAQEAKPYTIVNIVGVVVDIMAPITTRTGDEMFTIKLTDDTIRDYAHIQNGLRVRFFRKPNQSVSFPEIRSIGDVAIMKSMKMMQVAGQIVALSSYLSSVLVFPAATIPKGAFSLAYLNNNAKQTLHVLGPKSAADNVSAAEQTYVIQLAAELDNIGAEHEQPIVDLSSKSKPPDHAAPQPIEKPPPLSGFGQKFALVRDVKHAMFKDLVVDVVKQFYNDWGHCELYVTDYTENKDLWYYTPPEEETEYERDGDTFGYSAAPKQGWTGPYGYRVLKVNVKPPHDEYVRNSVQVGNIVVLRNVKMKINPHSANARLEGDMWRDDRNSDKVNVSVQRKHDIAEVERLFERKAKYKEGRKQYERSAAVADQPGTTLSKAQQKKHKQKKSRENKSHENNKKAADEDDPEENTDSPKAIKTVARNIHVRCSHEERSVSPLSILLDHQGQRHICHSSKGQPFQLPFVMMNIRAKVRVVDYEPENLEDFAFLSLSPDDESGTDPSYMDIDGTDSRPASQQWKWHWILHLEDATTPSAIIGKRDRIAVHIQHESAQFLLGNDMPDPQNLHEHPDLLNKLRYKLSILWGDLAECRGTAKTPSNLPFECCLLEYGVEVDEDDAEMQTQFPLGWMKMYGLFGTTILS